MTQTPDTEKIVTEQRSGAGERRSTISLTAADRLGLSGPEGSRRRGALLRRLLALGDWTALIVTLFAVTATTTSTDVADLFWAVLFSPSWIIVVKLHGLYDHDHRRIRHSTLDEVPALVSASALGTLGVTDPTRHAPAFVALITGLGVRRLGTGAADTEAVTGALLTLLRGALGED